MDEKAKPAWMQDELVKDIPPGKLDFLGRMFAEGHGKSQKEMMAMLLPMMKKAKQEKLTFTQQEMTAAIAAIKKHSSPEELKQINKILEKSKGGA
ncbi:MAG TPA: hypothetical protein H9742_03050 [Candidatus Acetatifactor stercoripullorum]|uniref:Uncharacterized protein n=1 Tax=Candidatus Acetatifactor stercoripullorum TaxID=2838414 RepID=A0A9D1R5K7_9FIRM|nr:hypothetical protein [Candidatus Acetatifactor stercoripullorum]HIW80497.1 hypothetical protein [Candidatus Acetatifactor stercoripullorum]